MRNGDAIHWDFQVDMLNMQLKIAAQWRFYKTGIEFVHRWPLQPWMWIIMPRKRAGRTEESQFLSISLSLEKFGHLETV